MASGLALPRRLFLVRHGQTEGESSIRFHGRNDVRLCDLGRAQIRRLIPLLANERFTAVVHSPLQRASESAQILIRGLATAPPHIAAEHAFTEVWFGALEGMTEPEIHAAHPEWHARWKQGQIDGYPGGDTIAEFSQRVRHGFDTWLARVTAGDLLVVAHRGVIRRGLMHLLSEPHAGEPHADAPHAGEPHADAPDVDAQRFGVDLGSLTIVELGPVRKVVQLNQLG